MSNTMANTNYTLVSIEGNIGSGKSTLLNQIRRFYNNKLHSHNYAYKI